MVWKIEGTAQGYQFTLYIRAVDPSAAIEKAKALFVKDVYFTAITQLDKP